MAEEPAVVSLTLTPPSPTRTTLPITVRLQCGAFRQGYMGDATPLLHMRVIVF